MSEVKTEIQGMSSPNQNENPSESTNRCGICLADAFNGGGASRGYIDSCNHYFCFVCIMEWAKVESKCPLCKCRFSTILRPPRGQLTCGRVVHVPVRDQVYSIFGNSTLQPPDLYSEVKCGICHNAADESLTLLCDLCDFAAHTYCVGLGVTVPESDWFCQDCTLLRAEHDKMECFSGSGIVSGNIGKLSSAEERVHISEIVREPYEDEIQRPKSSPADLFYMQPSCSAAADASISDNNNSLSSRSQQNVAQFTTKSNARTLQLCKNVNLRIRILREKWDSLRSGTLCFSTSRNDGTISSREPVSSLRIQQSGFCSNEHSAVQYLSGKQDKRQSYDTIKAWKMMDKARSIKQGHGSSSLVHRTAKCSRRKLDFLIKVDGPNSSRNVQSNEPRHRCNHGPGKQKWNRPFTVAAGHCHESSEEEQSLGHQGSSQLMGPQIPTNLHSDTARYQEKHAAEKSSVPARLISSFVPESMNSDMIHIEKVNDTSPPQREVKHSKEKKEGKKIYESSKQFNDAKTEIQSLVKLNLKLQMKKHQLEVDDFKEVARLATHSILAACGLKDSEPGFPSHSDFICSHASEISPPQTSLMTNSCRECFYVSVANMVNVAVLQKKKVREKHNVNL